jgi:hypothetical protein
LRADHLKKLEGDDFGPLRERVMAPVVRPPDRRFPWGWFLLAGACIAAALAVWAVIFAGMGLLAAWV